jgi:hypothetical protein
MNEKVTDAGQLTLDGNVCFHYSFSIFDDAVGLREDDEQELRDAIKSAYPNAVFDDDADAGKEPLFRDLAIGKGFLHGGGLPFECFRALLKSYELKFQNYTIGESAVFMTVFPNSDTAQVCICISVKGAGIDDFAYFRHVQGNGAKMNVFDREKGETRELSVKEIFDEVSGCLNRKVVDVEGTYLVEVKRWGDEESADEIVNRHTKEVYGIMTGDEGWRHVPQSLALKRMENSWGSREFIRFISFGTNSVFINLFDSKSAQEYRENRRRFDAAHYGDMDPYFSMNSEIAGVNHGILFSVELVMVIKTICDRILRRQAMYYGSGKTGKLGSEIHRIKTYRGELITTLNKVENLEISEIGELERVILTSQQIDPIIDKIKYLLELLESELDLLYQTSTNRLINFLTVAGLILAALQVLQGLF